MNKNFKLKIKQLPDGKSGRILYDVPHKRKIHEVETAETLLRFGENVIFLKPSNIPHIHTPDCVWRGEKWEMKAPSGNSAANIIRAFREAMDQSGNIIIDISGSRRSVEQAVRDILSHIRARKAPRFRKMLVLNRKVYCVFRKDDI